MPHLTPALAIAALLTLLPLAAAAFFPAWAAGCAPQGWRGIVCPTLLCLPYLIVAIPAGIFHPGWLALYALLPAAMAALLQCAARLDPRQHGTWIDYGLLLLLGLAVDLRWFQGAWPARLAAFNKILLLDAGIYGFLAVRRLHGVGFSLRMRATDILAGLRELLYYAPIAIILGLALRFLHFHPRWPTARSAVFAWCFTFLLIAIPEELFFRGWLQNLLERRLGRRGALAATSILFGLSHFNKRSTSFNWRYVLLAAIAGVFYGRAWRSQRRVAASAITHASVDTLWSLFLR